jgi:hypothetical protein
MMPRPTRSKGILTAAAQETTVFKWVALPLCAIWGSRLGILSDESGDIGEEDGIPFMHIRSDAGAVKNEFSERRVPLHPHVCEVGFLKFVRTVGSGRLFYDPRRRKPDAKKPPAKIVVNWRSARTVSASASASNSEPCSPKTASQGYGEVRPATKARAIAKKPLIVVWSLNVRLSSKGKWEDRPKMTVSPPNSKMTEQLGCMSSSPPRQHLSR